MMNPPRRLACLLAATVALAGCASSRAASLDQSAAPSKSASTERSDAGSAAHPSATALMVCGDDIRSQVRHVLALAAPPATTNSFADGRYSCTYHLPLGPLVLAVQQSSSPSAAGQYFAGQRAALHGDNLPGLGQDAFGTGTGIVVVIKDSETLTVDATKLPAIFGSQQEHRTDLAYEIASDVLGCWTGD